MKHLFAPAALALLLLAGCSQKSDEYAGGTASMDVASMEGASMEGAAPARLAPAEPAQEAAADAAADTANAAAEGVAVEGAAADPAQGIDPVSIPVNQPKIAYVYDFGYRVAADQMSALQRKHADLCEKQGPMNCRILEMRSSGGEGEYADGSLALAVAAPKARAFGAELAKAAGDAGGEEVSSTISGEDLSKQIVDTEARLRARSLLRDRLMEVLASRKGSVAELVEAERGVAQVNEEIDQARSWLAEMKTRVDYSRVNIAYSSGAPSGGGFLSPIRDVFGSLGSILGTVIAGLIGLVAVLVPLGLFGWGLWWLVHTLRRRFPQAAARSEAASGE